MYKSDFFKAFIFIVVFSIIIAVFSFSNINFFHDNFMKIENVNKLTEAKEKLDEEIEYLNAYLQEKQNQLSYMQEKLQDISEKNIETKKLLNIFRIVCARTDLRGPGITVMVGDNLTNDPQYSVNDKIVHDFDVRMIVNDLNRCGAEAIMINGKRIINKTEIICMGPVIRINGEVVAAPFIIKAIGNPEELMKSIKDPKSYAYSIKKDYGINITAMKSNDIYVVKSHREIDGKYAKLIEEGE